MTALETGVKGGVWFSLMDKVYGEVNLRLSAIRVAENKGAPGVDHVSVDDFMKDIHANASRISESLRGGTYEPQAIRRVFIPKPGSNESRRAGRNSDGSRSSRSRCGALRH